MKMTQLFPALMLCLAANANAALIHQYDLKGSLDDKLGGPALVGLGGRLVDDGYAFGRSQGLRLDAHLGDVYSIDMRFRFDDIGSNTAYKSILHYENSDRGFYLLNSAFNLYPTGTTGGRMTSGEYSRITVTRDANKEFKVYQDGDLVLSVLDQQNIGVFASNFAYFFRDNSNENGIGAVDFINIYDHALSAAEVIAPPGTEVPEPMPLTLMGAGLALLGWGRRRV